MTDIEQIQDRMRSLEVAIIRADIARKGAIQVVHEIQQEWERLSKEFEDAQSALYQAVKGGSK